MARKKARAPSPTPPPPSPPRPREEPSSDEEEEESEAEATAPATQKAPETMRRGFDELQNLYPNLTSYVDSIRSQHPCGETLKRAFELIADDKACALEAKIKKQRVAEIKTEIRLADARKEVTNAFIGLMD